MSRLYAVRWGKAWRIAEKVRASRYGDLSSLGLKPDDLVWSNAESTALHAAVGAEDQAIDLTAAEADFDVEAKRQVEAKYRAAAQARSREGELEVDDGAVVNVSEDPGAYVQAWLWVEDDEAGIERD